MAKAKLFSTGPWLFYDHEKPLAGGSGGALAPPGRPKVTAPGGNLGVALRPKQHPGGTLGTPHDGPPAPDGKFAP